MIRRILAILLTGGLIMALFGGCQSTKYNVDYCGKKDSFKGAKDSYRAGEKVELIFKQPETDGDYSFFVEGARVSADYEADKGYIFSFTMPQHDVSVNIDSNNAAVCVAGSDKTAELSFHSFDGGGPSFRVKIEDESLVTYDQRRVYTVKNREMVCGAGYTVYVTFFGLKPGKTTAVVEARSPIAENFDAVYDIEVSEDLSVVANLREQIDVIRD